MRMLLAIVAVALALAPSARGDVLPLERPVASVRVTESLKVARSFWRVNEPCVSVYAATYDAMRAVGGMSVAGLNQGCHIWLDTWSLAQNNYEQRIRTCTTIVHEYGHALGFMHSTDPHSIMSVSRPYNAVVYGCYRRFMPRGKARKWRDENGPPLWLMHPAG